MRQQQFFVTAGNVVADDEKIYCPKCGEAFGLRTTLRAAYLAWRARQ